MFDLLDSRFSRPRSIGSDLCNVFLGACRSPEKCTFQLTGSSSERPLAMPEWSGCHDVQVLGVTKRGASGVRNINATLHAMASAAKPRLQGWGFAEGDPMIYLVNDYQKELWNGSLGRIESVLSLNGKPSLLCSLDGARQKILGEEFHHIDLAYAITVHKAQGSQFKRVVVPIVRSRLLDRTLIYTALTRGMEQVVFIGDRDAFDAAVAAPPQAHDRQVAFSV